MMGIDPRFPTDSGARGNNSLGSNGLTAQVPCARASGEATARHGPPTVPEGVSSDTSANHPTGAQTDPQRFFLPFDHHLRNITEAPDSACAPADGMGRKAADLTNRSALSAWEQARKRPLTRRHRAVGLPSRRGGESAWEPAPGRPIHRPGTPAQVPTSAHVRVGGTRCYLGRSRVALIAPGSAGGTFVRRSSSKVMYRPQDTCIELHQEEIL
jgi:hypothetical protein